jgi:hypothetical protein
MLSQWAKPQGNAFNIEVVERSSEKGAIHMNWKYIVSWIPGIPIAIINGLIRTSLYMQFLNELQAHQLSAVSFIVLFGIYVWFILYWLKLSSPQEAVRLGLSWLVLTVVFEFLFGHFVMGHPWSRLVYDYNILAGRVWILVLFWITASPSIFYRLHRERLFSKA